MTSGGWKRLRVLCLMAQVAAGCCLLCAPALAQDEQIDFERANQIRQKMLRGERPTAEEKGYLDRARAALRREQAQGTSGRVLIPRGSTGLTPLVDLPGEGRYQNEDGGLYGAGRNEPPGAHLQAALKEAGRIQPLDERGNPSPKGKVALISVGMSNTTQEFRAFAEIADRDADRSSFVVLVDGAQGGMEASTWAFPERLAQARPRRRDPWTILDERLARAGVGPRQVQAAWIKQARADPESLGAFPRHARELQANLAVIARKLKERFSNLRLAYVSSRIYGGYSGMPLNPEPYAYESAFAVRWLIQDQIRNDPSLSYDSAQGGAKAPLLLWGPYLWADGVRGRMADGVVWMRDDLAVDGTHPSVKGQRKVAELLLRFFKSDPTAKPWFVKPSAAHRATNGSASADPLLVPR